MKKNLFIDLSIFLILTVIPLIFFYFQLSSLNEMEMKKRFIAEVIKVQAFDVGNENPQVEEVIYPENYANLNFGEKIKTGDYIFVYKNMGVGVFVDKNTEQLIGVGFQ